MSGSSLSAEPPTMSTAIATPKLPLDMRQTMLVGMAASLCSAAAAITQFASKVNASAAYPSAGHGAVRFDAGWPFTYAHEDLTGINASSFATAVHSPPRLHTIFWGAFSIDVMMLALIFALGLGIVLGAWSLAWRWRPSGSLKRFMQLGALGLGLAAVWLFVSCWIISGINVSAPTDAATITQITQPPAVVYLAPGVGQYLIQRWFDDDNGPAIALTGGPAAAVAMISEGLIMVALPAALLTVALANGMRLRAWWSKQ